MRDVNDTAFFVAVTKSGFSGDGRRFSIVAVVQITQPEQDAEHGVVFHGPVTGPVGESGAPVNRIETVSLIQNSGP